MSNTTNPQSAIPAKVEFISFHEPVLKDGPYTMTVDQTVETTSGDNPIAATTYSTTLDFVVSGERFSLRPQEIKSVFPPQSSMGDHSNVLPHVMLTRSTLPWERNAIANADPSNETEAETSWLMLLLIDKSEASLVTKRTMTVGTLQSDATASPDQFPTFDLEPAQNAGDSVTVIDVNRGLLQKLMPSAADLRLMAQVRQGKDDNDTPVGDEFATVIGNRLPRGGSSSTAYLVSVENRYSASGFDFDSMTADTVRLVMLHSWRFTCASDSETFEGLLKGLNNSYTDDLLLRCPATATNTDATEPYLSQGLVPLNFQQINGEKTVSWYRGPFIPGANTQEISLPVQFAQDLVQSASTDSPIKLMDLSYAAAWELGRFLTLQSSKVSVALYNWKCQNRQQLAQKEQKLLHLPKSNSSGGSQEPNDPNTQTVAKWFDQLSLLQGVPFNYLVPSETMLPVESIRFFQVDSLWVDCLLDGAFSIGRVMNSDHAADQQQSDQLGSVTSDSLDTLTGFLLRSDLVSGWPNLQVDGKLADGTACTLLRMDRVSSSVLLCLFSGQPATVNIHQRPEGLFFGVEDDGSGSYRKTARNSDGSESNSTVSITWANEDDRVINLSTLATDLFSASDLSGTQGATTTADFAMQMIEGVGKRSYSISTGS